MAKRFLKYIQLTMVVWVLISIRGKTDIPLMPNRSQET